MFSCFKDFKNCCKWNEQTYENIMNIII
jgi:hypothetical protein